MKLKAQKQQRKVNITKRFFFEKIKKTDKPLARLNRRKREKGHKLPISGMKQEIFLQNLQLSK